MTVLLKYFYQNVLIIEGDTEELVFKETILRMPEHMQKSFLTIGRLLKREVKLQLFL